MANQSVTFWTTPPADTNRHFRDGLDVVNALPEAETAELETVVEEHIPTCSGGEAGTVKTVFHTHRYGGGGERPWPNITALVSVGCFLCDNDEEVKRVCGTYRVRVSLGFFGDDTTRLRTEVTVEKLSPEVVYRWERAPADY